MEFKLNELTVLLSCIRLNIWMVRLLKNVLFFTITSEKIKYVYMYVKAELTQYNY